MRERRKLLGYYNYTVILTYLGMLMGLTGIAFVLEGKFYQAVICLMAAGICDMFDGTIASTKQRDSDEKRFGIQIDSLSDLICFGVLPGFLVYTMDGQSYIAFLICCIYILCALIRLAYFNVLEEERQQKESDSRKYYLGLPVTTIALIIPALFAVQKAWMQGNHSILLLAICLAAVAFVMPIRIKKPYLLGKIGIVLAGIVEFIILFIGMVTQV